ncbi:MAG: DUF5666 domain-containing protein [Pseudomonadota bacterium]
MIKTNRRTILALLGSSALSACAAPAIVSRDATDPFEGGIGGTGIIGPLTDFGSLIVNGLRVEVTSRTRVFTAFGPVDETALAPGQSLTVYATRSRDALVARRVQIDHALIGTLTRTAEGLSVNGVPIVIDRDAPAKAVPGQRVAVSGTWAPDRLVVDRIDPGPDGPDVIAGTLIRSRQSGLLVAGATLSGNLSGNRPGQYTTVFGTGTASGLDVTKLETGRFKGVSDLRQLSVEGYLEPIDANPGYRIAGLGHSFARDLRLAPLADQRAVYFGRYTGLFRAQLGYVVPEDYIRRRALLRKGYDHGFDGQVLRL